MQKYYIGSFVGFFLLVGLIGIAIWYIDIPKQAKIREDRETVSEVRRISSDVERYYNQNSKLPNSFLELGETRSEYSDNLGYYQDKFLLKASMTEDSVYEVCATFNLATKDSQIYPPYGRLDREEIIEQGVSQVDSKKALLTEGLNCFVFDAIDS